MPISLGGSSLGKAAMQVLATDPSFGKYDKAYEHWEGLEHWSHETDPRDAMHNPPAGGGTARGSRSGRERSGGGEPRAWTL